MNPNLSYTILSRQKQQVRLSEGEFEDEEILPEAIERMVLVCKKFTDLARTFNADEFVGVATSAARETVNQNDLLNRLRHEAQLDVRVTSEREEARLINMGVVTGIHLGERQVLFIDIGGGSTEIAVGGERGAPGVQLALHAGDRGHLRLHTADPARPSPRRGRLNPLRRVVRSPQGAARR